MSKKYKQTYLYLWILLAIGLAVVCGISFFSEEGKIGNIQLTKGTFRDVILAPELTEEEKEAEQQALEAQKRAERHEVIAETDTTVQTVLIFGDSMTILVANRLAAYGEKNGYRVASVTWDGSSTISWSNCDTLDNFIARYRPDFIMVTLGSNELFLKNFDQRRPYVEKIIKKIGNIPFVWISPPNWKEDVGFNSMMLRTLPPGTYYDSNQLKLERRNDHIHPTPKAGITWTDSIMSWIAYTPHPIKNVRPDPGVGTRPHHSHYYKAGKGGGGQDKKTIVGKNAETSSAPEHQPGQLLETQPTESAPEATPTSTEQNTAQPAEPHHSPAPVEPAPSSQPTSDE